MMIKRLWQREFEDYLGLAFEVVGGRIVYHWKRDRRPVITALRGDDGNVEWERVFDPGAVSYFFSHVDRLYFEGEVARCLDVETGETKAERDLGTRVVPHPGPRWVIYRGREPVFLVGLALDTLEELWRFPDGRRWESHNDFLCRHDTDGTIQFVELPTMKTSLPIQGPPREPGGRGHTHLGDLWCRFDEKERVGIDGRSGAIVWRKEEADFGYHHTPRFAGDIAYSGDRGLSAYDLKTGDLLWRQNFGREIGWLSSSPYVMNGRIYVGGNDGSFHIVEAATGKMLLSHSLDFEPREVVPLDADRVITASSEVVACFRVSV